jgi:hypothetical protein
MGRLVACLAVIVAGSASSGCGLGPRNFRKITHPAPLMRARAMSLGYNQPETVVLAALVGRLNDSDPVVRLAAHEELKKRTRRDLGYKAWDNPEDRASAISRWHAWLTKRWEGRASPPQRPRKSLPGPSPQSR